MPASERKLAARPTPYSAYLLRTAFLLQQECRTIDFDFERMPHEKSDRVKIVMTGKLLPYKYCGAEQGLPQYGFKED